MHSAHDSRESEESERVEKILELPAGTQNRRISIQENRLETAWTEFFSAVKKIDGLLPADAAEELNNDNLALKDKYVEAKCFISENTRDSSKHDPESIANRRSDFG